MENIKPEYNIETLRETIVVESSLARLNIDAPSFVLKKIVSASDFLYRIPGGKFLKDLNFHEWEIPTLSITVESDVYKQEWRGGILRIAYGDTRLNNKDCFKKDKYLERDLVWLTLTVI